ncbi:MAG: uroporphyrinogen decarboxylase [Bdellovibrionales bacterium]|nr:uroporphyrinogen decarboxylase [Bdellovibrionales bacterium]
MANLKFENAIRKIPQATPPVWMMRQAGRYHKHYQALRAKHSFMELCKRPELAAEVALGPIEDFDFDVSILFSDLLFPLEVLGMGLEYKDTGPELGWSLEKGSLAKLAPVETAIRGLEFQAEAVSLTRKRLPSEKSLIGFVGGPWTLYVYAVEGGHSGSLVKSKSQPELYRAFAERLVPLLERNIRLQLDAGAEVVMIFDTAAGELAPADFRSLVARDLETLFAKFPGRIGYYSKGTQPAHFSGDWLARKELAGFGVDHRWNLAEVLRAPHLGFVQGNYDQALLHLEPRAFEASLREYLAPLAGLSAAERAGWVCGLGHGVLPKTPEENVRNFVRIVREVFR